MLRIAEKYIFFLYLKTFLSTTGIFSFLFTIGGIVDVFTRSKSTVVPIWVLLKISVFKVPFLIQETSNYIVIFSIVYFFYRVTQDNQITIFQLLGFSRRYFSIFLFVINFFIGIFLICILSPITTVLLYQSQKLNNLYLEKKTNEISLGRHGIFLREKFDNSQFFIHIQSLEGDSFKNFTLVELDKDFNFIQKVNFSNIKIKDKKWENTEFKTNVSVEDIEKHFHAVETISFWELLPFIEHLKSFGYIPHRHEVYFYHLLYLPLLLGIVSIFVTTLSPFYKRENAYSQLVFQSFIYSFLLSFCAKIASISLSKYPSLSDPIIIISIIMIIWIRKLRMAKNIIPTH